MSKPAQDDRLIMSKAVKEWYLYYNVAWDGQATTHVNAPSSDSIH